MKTAEVKQKVLSDIKKGDLGGIGDRFLPLRAFCKRYGVSYRTAFRLYEELKAERILAVRDKSHILLDCDALASPEEKPLLGLHVRDVSNAFYGALCAALDAAARARGYDLLIMSSDNDVGKKRAILRDFLRLGCKGVLNLNSLRDETLIDFYRLYPLPQVLYGLRPLPDLAADFVLTDNRLSGRQAAKHLVEIGAQEFFYLTNQSADTDADERFFGFRDFLGERGVQMLTLPADVNEAGKVEYLGAQLRRAAAQKKIGIFCHHDLLAVTVLRLLHKKNVRIPEQAAVIGFDNLPVAEYTSPNLTTFAYSYRNIAEQCLNLLERRLQDRNASQRIAEIPTALLIRDSTKPKE